MAPADSFAKKPGPSPRSLPTRDHADTDADMSPARKRVRLSEECDDEVLIVGDSDVNEDDGIATGTSPDSAVIMVVDTPYSASLEHYPELDDFRKAFLSRSTLDPSWVARFQALLREHVKEASTDTPDTRIARYRLDLRFFGSLADSSRALLNRNYLFDTRDATDREVRAAFTSIYLDLARVCCFLFPLLPINLESALSRRDSAQPSPKAASDVPLLGYIDILASLFRPGLRTTKCLYNDYDLNLGDLEHRLRKVVLADTGLFPALLRDVTIMSGKPSIFKDAWGTISSGLFFLYHYTLWLTKDENSAQPWLELQELTTLTTSHILPAICREKPSNFPSDVLATCVSGFHDLLKAQQTDLPLEAALLLYTCYTNSSGDRVLLEDDAIEHDSDVLSKFCGNDPQAVMNVLRVSWTMQACKSCLMSDFMTTRTAGTKKMSELLVQEYHEFSAKGASTHPHPVLRYLVKFLRSNDLISYIFSAKSHANLVGLSVDTVGFLAATAHYSNSDTDAIWQACTTSVEAQFVQASIKVLSATTRYLNVEQSLHLAAKYAGIPLHSLDRALVALLPILYKLIEDGTQGATGEIAEKSMLIPVEIAKSAGGQGTDESMSAKAVLDASLEYLSRYATPLYSTKDRNTIYERCAGDINQKSEVATSSIRIIGKLFDPHQDQILLNIVSPLSAVDEYRNFIDGFRDQATIGVHNACIHRLRLILQLLRAASDGTVAKQTQNLLWDYAIGPKALSGGSRDAAWDVLLALPDDNGLIHRCLTYYVPTLSSQYATPRLLNLLKTSLEQRIQAECTDDFNKVPHLPQWKQLSRIANESDHSGTSARAAQIMAFAMFEFPPTLDSFDEIKESVVECQVATLRNEVDMLTACEHPAAFARHMTAIKGILSLSQFMRDTYAATGIDDCTVELNDYCHGAPDTFELSLRPSGRCHDLKVRAGITSTASELLCALRARYGVDCRIVADSRVVNLATDEPLGDLGLSTANVLSVQPEQGLQAFGPAVDELPVPLTAIEEELADQYERLQLHLDADIESVASETLSLLQLLRPSITTRRQILSTQNSEDDLLPAGRKYRAAHTILFLEEYFKSINPRGAVDRDFNSRGYKLLLHFLSRHEQYGELLVFQALRAVNAYLCVKLAEEPLVPKLETPAALAFCAASCLQRSVESVHARLKFELVSATSQVFFNACEIDHEVWHAFFQHSACGDILLRVLLHADPHVSRILGQRLHAFFERGHPVLKPMVDVWRVLTDVLPKTKQRHHTGLDYYRILSDIVVREPTLTSDEAKVRGWIHALSRQLFETVHTETPEVPFPDTRIVGLLEALAPAIDVLGTFGNPLGLEELSMRLSSELLWPKLKDWTKRPLAADDTRRAALTVVQKTCQSSDSFLGLVDILRSAVEDISEDSAVWTGTQEWTRQPGSNCGLSNLGQTCFMNSLLQQLFGNIALRKLILNTSVNDSPQYAVLRATQELFAQMQDSTFVSVATHDLANILNIQHDTQEDVHTFHSLFMTQLEESMPDRETKIAFRSFFNGKALSQIRGECGHVSETAEDFGDLSVVVKNKANLKDSIDEFMQGEPMAGDNQYKCYTCDEHNGAFVDAMKRNCLAEIPDNLAVCLKRFQFDDYGNNTKLNDRFEFPEDIDMAVYKKSHLTSPGKPHTPDIFRLVGVIVHLGSLDYGHYWSYVRLRGAPSQVEERWVRLEDTTASPSSLEEVQTKCFGNGSATDSAYVLFYQRIGSIEQARELSSKRAPGSDPWHVAPARVDVLPEVAQRIAWDNRYRQRIAQLHDLNTTSFLRGMLSRLDDANADFDDALQFPATMAHLAMVFVKLVHLKDYTGSRAEPIFEALTTHATSKPMFAHWILQSVGSGAINMHKLLESGNSDVRGMIYGLLLECLGVVRQHLPALYGLEDDDSSGRLSVKGDFNLLVQTFVTGFQALKSWPYFRDYFVFAGQLAQIGACETAIVLDHDLVRHACTLCFTEFSPGLRKEWSAFHNHIASETDNLTAVFDFLVLILGTNVDLHTGNFSPEDARHVSTPSGCVLRESELATLLKQTSPDDHTRLIGGWLMYRGLSGCPLPKTLYRWEHHAPGKLLGILTSPKADMRVSRPIREQMLKLFNVWDGTLMPLMVYTLHHCKTNGDSHSTGTILTELCKLLEMWEGFENDMIEFAKVAMKLAPRCTLAKLQSRLAECLTPTAGRKPFLRRDAEAWYKEYVFDPLPITLSPPTSAMDAVDAAVVTDDDLTRPAVNDEIGTDYDVARVWATRLLVSKCSGILTDAYRQGSSTRQRHSQMLDAMQEAKSYLDRLVAEVKKQKDAKAKLKTALEVEVGEISRTRNDLQRLLALLRDWQYAEDDETLAYGLPQGGVIESVEDDDEDAFDSDDSQYTDELLPC